MPCFPTTFGNLKYSFFTYLVADATFLVSFCISYVGVGVRTNTFRHTLLMPRGCFVEGILKVYCKLVCCGAELLRLSKFKVSRRYVPFPQQDSNKYLVDQWLRKKIRLIEGNAKSRRLKKLTCNGT